MPRAYYISRDGLLDSNHNLVTLWNREVNFRDR
jgi:hypothetical protein